MYSIICICSLEDTPILYWGRNNVRVPTSGCMSLAHMVASLHYVPSANILVKYLFKEENNTLKRHVTRFFPNIWYSYCKFKLLISWFLLGFTIFLTKQKKLLFQWSLLFLRSFYMFFFSFFIRFNFYTFHFSLFTIYIF